MKFNSDIDIDVADRSKLLEIIDHTAASIYKSKQRKKHNSGIYVTEIPYDPVHDAASLSYEYAEKRGYVKLDILNVYVYSMVRDENHLLSLMKPPDWTKLSNREFVEQLVHLGNHYDELQSMPEKVDSIKKLAMFLAIIRPGKKHLLGLPWADVEKTVWQKSSDDSYSFKRSHSLAYATLVTVHMNLFSERNGETIPS
jgi:hypothetical protein